MPRLPNIEIEQAIAAAQTLFWKHGYHGLGTRQLEKETGLTRFSLQTNYGGKKSLFLKTLDLYCDYFEAKFLPEVSGNDLEGLAVWFESRADTKFVSESGCYGCLMLNSAVEFQGQDDEVNLRTQRFTQSFQNSFRAVLDNAKAQGTVSSSFDVESNTKILHGVALGLNVIIRANEDNAAGEPLATATARMIRGWQLG